MELSNGIGTFLPRKTIFDIRDWCDAQVDHLYPNDANAVHLLKLPEVRMQFMTWCLDRKNYQPDESAVRHFLTWEVTIPIESVVADSG